MPLKYRDNMSPEEVNALLAEEAVLDQCYSEAAAFDAKHADLECDEEENFDPVRDGWVGRNGLP